MKCNNCNNTKEFTLVEEVAFWNKETKKFEPDLAGKGEKYPVCDMCGSTDIDTEGDY
jgi:hypothetical protein